MIGLDARVTALGAARIVGDSLRTYGPTGVDADSVEERHRAVEHIVRMALTGVGPIADGDYAVLDGYDDNGDIVADYGIRDARAFRFLYRKLNWRTDPKPVDLGTEQ